MEPRAWSSVRASLLVCALAGLGLAAAAAAGAGPLPMLLVIYAFARALALLNLSSAVSSRSLFVSAVADLALAILLFFLTPASAFGLNAVVGVWAMGTGLLGILGAGAFGPRGAARALFASGGFAGIAVGTWLGVSPDTSAPMLAGLIAGLGLSNGCLSLVLAVLGGSDAAASCTAGQTLADSLIKRTELGTGAGTKEFP